MKVTANVNYYNINIISLIRETVKMYPVRTFPPFCLWRCVRLVIGVRSGTSWPTTKSSGQTHGSPPPPIMACLLKAPCPLTAGNTQTRRMWRVKWDEVLIHTDALTCCVKLHPALFWRERVRAPTFGFHVDFTFTSIHRETWKRKRDSAGNKKKL